MASSTDDVNGNSEEVVGDRGVEKRLNDTRPGEGGWWGGRTCGDEYCEYDGWCKW